MKNFIDIIEYLITLGVFAYGLMNESVLHICIAIMMWNILNTFNGWISKNN